MLCDYPNDPAWGSSHRGWTTLLSFVLQATAITILLFLPLLSIHGLPPLQLIAALAAPASPPPRAPRGSSRRPDTPTSNLFGQRLMMPTRIPHDIANLNESELPPAPEFPGEPGVVGSIGSGDGRNSVLFGTGSTTNSMPLLSPTPAVRPVRISHMMEGNLIQRVQPEYPPLARQARIQGIVILRAIISREGRIEKLQLVSGHPMLVEAAIDAVRQWRYRPYLLNDQPVEVETQITVNFTLTSG